MMRRHALVPALLLSLAVIGAAAVRAGSSAEIFTLSDPRGDDYGAGGVRYPVTGDMRVGDLDVVSFSAREEKDGTTFTVTFASPVRVPERRPIDSVGTTLDKLCRFGFWELNVDVYIDTDRVAGSGSINTMPGRIAEIDPSSAWEKAVILTPRPFDARDELKKLALSDLRKARKEEGHRVRANEVSGLKADISRDLESRVFFPTRIDVSGRKIRFFVPFSFLGGPAKADWSYVVAVSGADYQQSFDVVPVAGEDPLEKGLMILPVEPGGNKDIWSGGDVDADGWQPALIDILVPPGARQEKILADYDPDKKQKAKLLGVVPAQATGK